MITDNFFRFLQVLIALYVFPITLPAQEDISVKFSFKEPNEYVCEIRNMTEYRMGTLLNKEGWEGRSALHFDIVEGTDTISYNFYSLMKDADQSRFLYLDPGQAYTVSYRDGDSWKFIKAHLFIDFVLIISNEISGGGYFKKDIDLQDIKHRNHVCEE
jgi:hypothetical protein